MRSGGATAILIFLLAAAAATHAAPEPPFGRSRSLQQAAGVGPEAAKPTVLLHWSDIHLSTNVRKYWKQFGDREGDALVFIDALLPRLGLSAALVTGDITDSKAATGEGLQQEAEWRAYGGVLRAMSAAGVPLHRVLDVPGNHDTFNMPARGGANDFFSRYAAEGQRRSSPQHRVYVHRLSPEPQAQGQQAADDAAGSKLSCPAGWLLGIDPTPEPGLRSPTNFAGVVGPELMQEVEGALQSIAEQAAAAAGCGAPLVLAYCHYPLSTVDSAPSQVAGPLGALLHAAGPVSPMQGLTKLLAEHNVSAVFSGHLHSAFGQRLHRMHTTPAGGHMAELETAAWKDDRRFRLVGVDGPSLSFLDLMFHTPNSPAMPSRSDAAATRDPAWQEAYRRRGWAVTALEPSAAVLHHIVLVTSPPDGRYSPLGAPRLSHPTHTASSSGDGSSDGSSDGSGSGSEGGEQDEGQEGWVRALVFPLDAGAAAAADTAAATAAAGGTTGGGDSGGGGLSVQLRGYLPGGAKLFDRPMQLQAAGSGAGSTMQGPLLYVGRGETTVSCVGEGGDPAAQCHPPSHHVLIQVSVSADGTQGHDSGSASPLLPAALRCAPLTASHQRCWVAAVEGLHLPLGSSLGEWLGLAFNWPVLVHRLFLLLMAFQVCALLLAPRLLGPRLLPLIAATPLLRCQPAALHTPPAPGSNSLAAAVQGLLRTCLSYLLWPAAALVLCASVTGVWAAMLAYSAYLVAGPWLLYPALTGSPPALLFHYGVLAKLHTGAATGGAAAEAAPRWHFTGTPDTLFVCLVHCVVCVLPATLWVACVVARRLQLHPCSPPASRSGSSDSGGSSGGGAERRRMESGRLSSPRSRLLGGGRGGDSGASTSQSSSFSAAQLAALLCLVCLNCSMLWLRTLSIMGPLALAASPGFAWTLPLALLLVTAWGGPRRRRCALQAGKGE